MQPILFAVQVSNPLDGEVATRWLARIHPQKAARIRRMRYPQADLSLAGELLARYALGQVFGVSSQTLAFAWNPGGKPHVVGHPDWQFNVSHSGELCVCAVCDRPVGVDIQKMQPARFDAIARRFFSEEDCARYAASENPQATFYRLWTKREALGKCLGAGLRPLKRETLPAYALDWPKAPPGYALCVCWQEAPEDTVFPPCCR